MPNHAPEHSEPSTSVQSSAPGEPPDLTRWLTVSVATEHLRERYHLPISRARVQYAATAFWKRVRAAHPEVSSAGDEALHLAALRLEPTDREVRAIRYGESERRSMFLVDPASLETLWLNLPRDHPDYRMNPRGGRVHGSRPGVRQSSRQSGGSGRPAGTPSHGVDERLRAFAHLAREAGTAQVPASSLDGGLRRAAERLVARGLLAKVYYQAVGAHGIRDRVGYELTEAGRTLLGAQGQDGAGSNQ